VKNYFDAYFALNYFFMKQVIFRYGLYATLVIMVLGALDFFVVSKYADDTLQEVAGYLTMLLSMIFVFMGIRHYRDRVNGGSLSFVQGLKIGVLIVLIPAVFFGLFDVLFTEVLQPGWKETYYTHYIDQVKANTPPAKLAAALKKATDEKEMFANPVFQFLLMSATVFIIGLMVTIISALTLRRKPGPVQLSN
jgi:heme/copper-type cytochrome/quinol oxidase subunit 2